MIAGRMIESEFMECFDDRFTRVTTTCLHRVSGESGVFRFSRDGTTCRQLAVCTFDEFRDIPSTLHVLDGSFTYQCRRLCRENFRVHKLPRSSPVRRSGEPGVVTLQTEQRIVSGANIVSAGFLTLQDVHKMIQWALRREKSSGADGTRTRDLLRDRQAF